MWQQRSQTSTSRSRPQIPALVAKKNGIRMDPGPKRFQVNNSTIINSETPQRKKTWTANSISRPHIIPPHPEDDEFDTPQKSAPAPAHFSSPNKQKSRSGPISRGHLSELHNVEYDFDGIIDEFLHKIANTSLREAIESFFKNHFHATVSIVWEEIPNLQLLFCESINSIVSHSNGLVGYTFFSRKTIRAPDGPNHPSYQQSIDEKLCPLKCPILLFPLWDWKNNINFIVQIVRHPGASEFTADDEQFVEWFSKKYKILSHWIKPLHSAEEVNEFSAKISHITNLEKFLTQTRKQIAKLLNCRDFEIWKMEYDSERFTRYTNEVEYLELNSTGIVGDSLSRRQTLNIRMSRLHNSYNPDIDGLNEAILSIPFDTNNQFLYALVLRGPQKFSIFTKNDEDRVRTLAPAILLAFTNAESFSEMYKDYQDSKVEREGLGALLEVVEIISSQLDTEKLTESIMEKGRTLTNSDRCSLFLVNEQRDRLITFLHQGLENSIDIPINKGIAGKTVMEGKILNISDVYETDFFDSSTDLETGYRTRSILSVPIYNNRGKIIGVTEMVNKLDEKPFTQWDQKLIQIFNVFCGISLENARLYKESMDMSAKLKSFFDTAFTMAQSNNMQRVVSDILQNAKNNIGAEKASIFLYTEGNDNLSTFITDTEKMPPTLTISTGIAALCIKNKEPYIVNDAYNHPRFNRAIDNITNYKTKSLLAVPILSAEGTVIGVTEVLNKKNGDFLFNDVQTVKAFSAFASIALENARLKDMAQSNDLEIELNKWIRTNERNGFEIPQNLQLTEEQMKRVGTLNCFSVDFKGIGHFKELFYFFSHFKLFETFKISNEVFFRFIFTISATYNNVPYHNWTHACDVTQYIFYQAITAELDKTFTSFELFGLLTSAICHDANHEGFNNIFNVKAETPFGILFKDQSVMEMHHITVSIPIITRDDINLFHSLDPEETKKMWNLFIKLILATDMANHFTLVKTCQTLLDENNWSFDVPENRLLALQLILKVADISNVSRPFELADKWCDILNNEFFRQGDLEKSTGIGLTSPLNDRENVNKPKSQIGFYNFICLPLYQVVSRIFPPLTVNFDSVNSNLSVWKSLMDPAS